RIKSVRRHIAEDLGIIVPPIHITDNLRLYNGEYSIKLKGGEIARGQVMIGRLLAIDAGSETAEIEDINTNEPSLAAIMKKQYQEKNPGALTEKIEELKTKSLHLVCRPYGFASTRKNGLNGGTQLSIRRLLSSPIWPS